MKLGLHHTLSRKSRRMFEHFPGVLSNEKNAFFVLLTWIGGPTIVRTHRDPYVPMEAIEQVSKDNAGICR